jgi:hypothetical protein
MRNQDSSVSILARLWDGCPGFHFWQGLRISLFPTVSRLALGHTQPPIQWVLGVLSPGVNWLVCEADHSPPSCRLRMHGSTPLLPNVSTCGAKLNKGYIFMKWCLIKHKNKFTFAKIRVWKRVYEQNTPHTGQKYIKCFVSDLWGYYDLQRSHMVKLFTAAVLTVSHIM